MIKHKSKITFENKELSKENLNYLSRFKKSLKARNRADSTIYNYTKDIEQFLQFIKKDITEVTPEDIHIYLTTFKDLGNDYKRIVRRFRVLSSYYSFLAERKIVDQDITLHIKIKDYE